MSKETFETRTARTEEEVLQANIEDCESFALKEGYRFSTLLLIAPDAIGMPAVTKLDGICDPINRRMLDRLYQKLDADLAGQQISERTPENSEYARDTGYYQRVVTIPTSRGFYFTENYARQGDWQVFDVTATKDDTTEDYSPEER